jgi:MoCo/4Fe-4S cofactor protein with predicted Tat translocation signal
MDKKTIRKNVDLKAVRSRLAEDGSPRLWQSLEELADTQEYRDFLHNEFPYDPAKESSRFGRRDLLKFMAASAAPTGLSGCTRLPTERIVPYVRAPEQIVPGKPLFYATSVTESGVGCGVLVESHMGRPTKVEGNPEHPGSLGASDIFAQASVLTLYDPDRSQTVINEGRISDWPAFANAMSAARPDWAARRGANFHILTEAITSPALADQIRAILAEFPGATWHQWEPCGRDAVREGAQLAFGQPVNTIYHFDRADVIVSLDADFLCSGPGKLRYARDFSDRRRVSGPQSTMNRLYVAESTPSNTGSMADHRLRVSPSDLAALAYQLAAGTGAVSAGAPLSATQLSQDWVSAVVRDLEQHRGASLVIAGDYQPSSVQALAHAMNVALGNVGHTVDYTAPMEAESVNQMSSLRDLVARMNAGEVDILVIAGANPVMTAPADLDFSDTFLKVKARIHLGLYFDETASLCHWHIPETHFLEAWGDARAYDGTIGIVQPLIAPLYQGKSVHEVFSALQGHPERSSHDVVHDYWKARDAGKDFETFWQKTLHDGVMARTALPPVSVSLLKNGGNISPPPREAQETVTVLFRPDPTIGDGRWANNGWLQELPKPLTKLTWDNAAQLSPATAERLGLASGEMVRLSLGGRELRAPVWILPGQADDCVTLHLGYGREKAGRVGTGIGVNAYRIRRSDFPWTEPGLKIEKLGTSYPLATTQHQYIMGSGTHEEEAETVAAFRRDLVRIATLDEFRKTPRFAQEPDQQFPSISLYPGVKYEGYAWGMSIDLNSCTGCGACVVACQAENNIAVVGKEEVIRGRAMHWIRVDTYYRGGIENPEIYHEPAPCMQCENAPCEVVCPVGATVHSPEGLNDMVYNRCVGTRYCSNNCPYKVRRFNFKLYSDWTTASLYGLRNPNVTVRSRGVMEKCTYCVQRINAAKIRAEEGERSVLDGEIVTACQQACPTRAIVFGNQNDPNSAVAKLKAQPRNYSLLADLNTRPRTTYLARLRNPNPEIRD